MIERLDLASAERTRANLVARHWPGPLTLVLSGGERRVPERLRGPEGGVAVRWTSHPAHHAADSRARRRHHVDEREPAGGSAGDVGRRDSCSSGATRSRAASFACSTAERSTPSQAVDGARLHRAAAARHSARRDLRARRCAKAFPILIGDA